MTARAKTIRYRGKAAGHSAAVALLTQAGDVAIDERGIARSLVMKCPDNCGDTLTINLDRRAGKAWRIDNRATKFTLYPSVWREEGCKAHFIMWRDCILWCDWHDTPNWKDDELVARVRGELRQDEYQHYEAIAERLAVIPWEVLWACQSLVRSGQADTQNLSYFRGKLGQPGLGRGLWV
jgi:hypothetical protein